MSRIYRHNPHIPNRAARLLLALCAIIPVTARAQDANPQSNAPATAASPATTNPLTPPEIDRLALDLRSDEPPGARRAAASAIASHPNPPPDLLPPLARAIQVTRDHRDLAEILRALARYPTTDAVFAALSCLDRQDATTEALRRAVRGAVAAQVARPELFADESLFAQWAEWFSHATERERRTAIATAHARRSEQLEAELQRANTRLLDVYRRLFGATPDEGRSTLLAELMRADQVNVRVLGIELATRTILNAKPVGPRVAEAAVLGLSHPDPSVRAASAALVDRLNLAEHAGPCADAFRIERDPQAASAMMRFLSRHPSTDVAAPALEWFCQGAPVIDASTELMLALVKGGMVSEPQARAVRDQLHALTPAQITPPGVALLDQLGEHERIAPLLQAPDARVAAAAAAALSASPDQLALILDAALSRPDLFEPACRALIRHRPDASGFADADSLRAPNPQIKRDVLTEFANVLSPEALLEVARRTTDLPTRERYLRRAAAPEFLAPDPDDPTRRRLIAMLIQTRLELSDPAGALAVLESFPPSEDAAENADCLSDRVHCLVWLNRLDEAQSLTHEHLVPASAWIAGLESAMTLPHAPKVLQRIRTVYAGTLAPDEAEHLDLLEVSLDSQPPA